MAVRSEFPFNGKRFIGNKLTKEVHDCNIEIVVFCKIGKIKIEYIINFTPDTLEQAYSTGYKNCCYCL